MAGRWSITAVQWPMADDGTLPITVNGQWRWPNGRWTAAAAGGDGAIMMPMVNHCPCVATSPTTKTTLPINGCCQPRGCWLFINGGPINGVTRRPIMDGASSCAATTAPPGPVPGRWPGPGQWRSSAPPSDGHQSRRRRLLAAFAAAIGAALPGRPGARAPAPYCFPAVGHRGQGLRLRSHQGVRGEGARRHPRLGRGRAARPGGSRDQLTQCGVMMRMKGPRFVRVAPEVAGHVRVRSGERPRAGAGLRPVAAEPDRRPPLGAVISAG